MRRMLVDQHDALGGLGENVGAVQLGPGIAERRFDRGLRDLDWPQGGRRVLAGRH